MKIVQLMLTNGDLIKSCHGEITTFEVNGEMARITWYRQTMPNGQNLDINRNFVAVVSWEGESEN
jgi:hypothetical protein